MAAQEGSQATAGEKKEEQGGALYSGPGDALSKVREDFHYWTEKLTDTSFNLSLAVIGANWAVFGTVDKVMLNPFARLSIALVLVGLGINLLGTKFMGERHRERLEYALADPERWKREFKETEGGNDPWPYTEAIERIARRLRFIKTWFPIVGGLLFLVALL